MNRRTKQSGIGGAVALILVAVGAAIAPLPAQPVERFFSRGIYPWIQAGVTRFSNVSPIALLDVVVLVVLVVVSRRFVRAARSSGWKRGATTAGIVVLKAVAVVYLLFLLLWGLNYRRVPLEDKLDFDRNRVTQERALTLAHEAVRRVNALYGMAHATTFDRGQLAASFAAAEHALGDSPGRTIVGRPKRSVLGFYFRQAAVDGMTNPLFLEVIINPDLLEVEKPEVLAHEWSHLAGYADESEANFLAWLTCLRGDPLAEYSGWLSAYGRAAGVLPRNVRATLPRLDAGPRQDLEAIAARYRRSSPFMRRAAREVYDSYLKANRIEEGIANYDVVLQLMLGTTLGANWTPNR